MAKYVDIDALLQQIDIDAAGGRGYYGDTWKFINTIKNMPTITITENTGHHIAETGKKLSYSCMYGKDEDCISRRQAIDKLRMLPSIKVSDDYFLIDKAEAMTELMLMPPKQGDSR